MHTTSSLICQRNIYIEAECLSEYIYRIGQLGTTQLRYKLQPPCRLYGDIISFHIKCRCICIASVFPWVDLKLINCVLLHFQTFVSQLDTRSRHKSQPKTSSQTSNKRRSTSFAWKPGQLSSGPNRTKSAQKAVSLRGLLQRRQLFQKYFA